MHYTNSKECQNIHIQEKARSINIICSILAYNIYLPLTANNSEDSAVGDDLRMQNLYIA